MTTARSALARARQSSATVPRIVLDGTHSIQEGSAEGTIVGALSVVIGGILSGDTWVYSLADSAGNRFKIVGANLEAGAVATNHATAAEHAIRIVAVNLAGGQSISLSVSIAVLATSVTISDIAIAWQSVATAGSISDAFQGSIQAPILIAVLSATPNDTAYLWSLASDPDAKYSVLANGDGSANLYLIASLLGPASHAFTARVRKNSDVFSEAFSLTVTHANRAPTDIAQTFHSGFSEVSIPEATALGSVLVDSFTIADEIGDTHTIAVADSNNQLAIVSDQLVLVGTLHAASQPVIAYTITVTDQSGLSFAKSFAFTVTPSAADSEANTLVAASTVPLTAPREANVRRLFARIKRAGWLANLDYFFCAASPTQQFANREWTANFGALSPQASCTWVADQGYIGDGLGMFVNLGINPSAGTPGAVKQTNADIFGMVLCTTDSDNLGKDLGSGNGRLRLVAKSAGRITGAAGQNAVSTQDNVGGVPPSMVVVTQKAGTQQLWRNASAVPADIDTVTPAALPTALTLLQTGAGEFSDRTVAFCAGGSVPATYLAQRLAALYQALAEYLLAILNEVVVPAMPDIDTTATVSGLTYARAGQMPYVDALGAFQLAAADTWPLDHDPVSPFATRGRRLPPAWQLVNKGAGRVFTGWTGVGGAALAASAAYTTFFGDTLGGLLSEGATATSAKNVSSPIITLDGRRGITAAGVVDPVAMVDRCLRVEVRAATGGANGFYADFTLSGAGTVARSGKNGNGVNIASKIEHLADGKYHYIVKGRCTGVAVASVQVKVWLHFVTAAGGVSVPGASNSVRIDDIVAVPHVSDPMFFGPLASVSDATLKVATTENNTFDIGLTNESGAEFIQRDIVGSGGTGPLVSWPLYASRAHPATLGTIVLDIHLARYTEQWVKRLRLFRAPDGEALVSPLVDAAIGKNVKTIQIPNTSPFTVTLSPAPGAAETVSIPGMTRVSSAPGSGQFSVSGAVITFNTANGGQSKVATYWDAVGYMEELSDSISGGSAAASWTDTTTMSVLGGTGTTSIKYRIPPSTTGELARVSVVVQRQNMTVRGHGRVFTMRGGGLKIGDKTHKPINISLEDMILVPGRDPIGAPQQYQQAFARPVQIDMNTVTGVFVIGNRVQQSNGAFGVIESILPGATGFMVYGMRPSGGTILNFFAGGTIEQRASPTAAVTASATVTAFTPGASPFAVTPAEGFGSQYDIREGWTQQAGDRIAARHIIALLGIDESVSIDSTDLGVNGTLIEDSIIAQSLTYPKDDQGRGLHPEEQPHGEASLCTTHASAIATQRCRNVTIRRTIYACTLGRHPKFGGEGIDIYNTLVFNPVRFGPGPQANDDFSFVTTGAYHDNLLAVGADTPAAGAVLTGVDRLVWVHSSGVISKKSDRCGLYYQRNYLTDLVNHANDTPILPQLDIGGAMQFDNETSPKILRREKPFYSAELAAHPEKCTDASTLVGRQTISTYLRLNAGVRARDANDNPIPGDESCWQTKRLIDGIFGKTLRTINSVAEMGGLAIDPPADGFYFVAPSGSDSNTGGIGDPFATLGKAQAAMRAGGPKKTYLRGGTYPALAATFTLTPADNSTSWVAYPGEVPVLTGASSITAIGHTGSPQGIIWDGVKFSGLKQAFFLDGLTGATGWIIKRCLLDGAAQAAIHLQNVQNSTIEDNTIQNGSGANILYAGIYCLATANGILANLTIQRNIIQDMAGPGIVIQNNTQSGNSAPFNKTYGFLVDANIVRRVNNAGLHDTGGIYVHNRGYHQLNGTTIVTPMGGIVSNNDISDVGDNGSGDGTKCLYLDDRSSSIECFGNICHGAATYGIQYHGGADNDVHNNRFDVTNMYRLGYYQDAGSPYTGMAANKFRSNIVVVTGAWPFATPWSYSLHAGEADPAVSANQYWSSTAAAYPNSGSVVDSSPIYPGSNPW